MFPTSEAVWTLVLISLLLSFRPPGVRHQQSGEAGHRSGVLCPSDEEDPAGPAEDSRGRGRQQAPPTVRPTQAICCCGGGRAHLMTRFCSWALQVLSWRDVPRPSRAHPPVLHQREPRSLPAQRLPLRRSAGRMKTLLSDDPLSSPVQVFTSPCVLRRTRTGSGDRPWST